MPGNDRHSGTGQHGSARAQGDSVLRVGIGVSAIHALGDGRWRPGMSGSDGARGADLWEVFSVVPDHRRAEGKRYPLAGLLMIALAAMLAGRSDQLGIVRWGRKLSREALAELGLLRGRVPAPSVWSELFRALDVGALERLLGAWVKGAGAAGHVAIDGKRLRGSAVGDVPGVHLLAAFSERLQGVIGQLRVAPEANEITAALTLLKTLPQDASHRGCDHQRRCDLGPDRPLSPHRRARRRLLVHGQEQPADAGSRHRPGLPAGFPPLRSGRPRLTWLGSRRSRRGTAASRSDAWSAARASPPLSASGRVCARSAASSDAAACAARTASRACTPSPACRASAPTPPPCSTSREGIGESRTACTTSAIGPAARTPAAPDPATPPRPSPPCETPPSPSIDAGGTVPSRARSTSPNIATRRSPSSNKREPNDPAPPTWLRGRPEESFASSAPVTSQMGDANPIVTLHKGAAL